MSEIIRQALDNCRSVYNLIHGPEVWLVFPLVCLVGFAIGFLIFYHWSGNND